ncbi:MAG: hypothetical protein ABIR11_13680 [Candidatus Limnocylindrales bacterium]
MRTRLVALAPADCPIVALLDRRLLAWGVLWGVVSLVAFGLVSAIIPNPVFGRQVPPEAFAIWVWLISAPLMGLVLATYTTPAPGMVGTTPLRIVEAGDPAAEANRGSMLGTIGGFGAFLAIGCPVCNKIALLLLGASGAMTVYAPIQPFIGAASLALLTGTLAWRLRTRARGGTCSV